MTGIPSWTSFAILGWGRVNIREKNGDANDSKSLKILKSTGSTSDERKIRSASAWWNGCEAVVVFPGDIRTKKTGQMRIPMANSAPRLSLVIWWVIKYRTPPVPGYKFLDTTVVANSSGRLLLPGVCDQRHLHSPKSPYTRFRWCGTSGDIVVPTVQKPAVGP